MNQKLEEVSIVIPKEDIKKLKSKFERAGFTFEEGLQHILREYIEKNDLEELYGDDLPPLVNRRV